MLRGHFAEKQTNKQTKTKQYKTQQNKNKNNKKPRVTPYPELG